MSFWNDDEGNKIASVSDYRQEDSGFKPIPNNTQARAMIDEASVNVWQGNKTIKLRWSLMGGEYKGRTVFDNVRVWDEDKAKASKHKRRFAAIDNNAGTGILESGEEPDDGALMNLVGKVMLIKIGLIPAKNDGKDINWIMAVSPDVPNGQSQSQATGKVELDDDIPF